MGTLSTLNRSRHRRSQLVNPKIVTILLFVIGVISVASWRVTEANWVEARFVRMLGRPAMLVHSGILGTFRVLSNLSGRVSAAQELDALNAKIDALSYENQILRNQANEVERLRRLLELPECTPLETVPALVRNWDLNMGTAVIINRGRADGLKINQPVITPEGVLGRTERVLEYLTRVQLMDDPGSAIGVTVEGKNWDGLIIGQVGEESLIFTELTQRAAQDAIVGPLPEPGDRLITSGVGNTFPAGLTVGILDKALGDEDGIRDGFAVRPMYQLMKLSEILVVVGPERTEEMLLLGEEVDPVPEEEESESPDEGEPETPLSDEVIEDSQDVETIEETGGETEIAGQDDLEPVPVLGPEMQGVAFPAGEIEPPDSGAASGAIEGVTDASA